MAWIPGRVAVFGMFFLIALAGRQPVAIATLNAPVDDSEPPAGELWVQNLNSAGTPVSVAMNFYAAAGKWNFPAVALAPPPRTAEVMRTGQVAAALPVGVLAAQLVSASSFPSIAVVRNEWPASGGAAMYDAIPGAADVVVPWVTRRRGAMGASSRVAVQDVRLTGGPQAVTVRLTPLGATSPTLTISRSIAAGTASVFDLARDADLAGLPDGFGGVMRVQAAAASIYKIAVAATTELANSSQAIYATAGADVAATGQRLAVPRVTRRRAGTRRDGSQATTDSFIAVANAGQVAANVSIRYVGSDEPGSTCAGQTFVHIGAPFGIAPGGGALFAQGAEDLEPGLGSSGLPDNCVATAVVESDGPPIAATVVELEDRGARAGAYSALPIGTAEHEVYVPLFRNAYNDLSTSVDVMNAGDAATQVQMKVTFVADNATRTATVSRTLDPNASAHWSAADLAAMPGGTFGAVTLTGSRADVPIVAVARETSDDGRRDNAMYEGLVKPALINRPFPLQPEAVPNYAPSLWHSHTVDLGLLVPATTPDEIKRISNVLSDQAFDFASATGYTIAVSVVPYIIGGVPFNEWLEQQAASSFPDTLFKARTWVVGINYNAVTMLGQQGRLVPLDPVRFPDRGDFIADAWSLNFAGGSDRPLALPWLRSGCTPTYRNLGLVTGARNADQGFKLIQFLAAAAQQRENYAPTRPQRTQIGYPTLASLYTPLAIQCPAFGPLIRTAGDQVRTVLTRAEEDAARLATVFAGLDVDKFGDAANASKAVGATSAGFEVVAQPMVNFIPPDQLDARLKSTAGLVVGTLSLHRLPTPTPTDRATATAMNTPTTPGAATATSTPPGAATATSTPPGAATATSTPPGAASATSTPRPATTATATATSRSTVLPTTPTYLAFLPYAAQGHFLRAEETPAPVPSSVARVRSAAGAHRVGDAESGDTYAVVWHEAPDGEVQPALLDKDGKAVDPASLGIQLPPVSTGFPGSAEPEAWAERGSIIICLNLEQHKGCLTIDH